MVKEVYKKQRFQPHVRALIDVCDKIVTSYVRRGFRLTVRQIYYQLVAKHPHLIHKDPEQVNTKQSYDRIQSMLNNARLAGLIDWDAIEDRTRDVIERSHWDGVKHMLDSSQNWYHEDMWNEQPVLVIAFVEKEALAGIFQHIFKPWDVPVLPARGYPSSSILREIAKERMLGEERKIVGMHFGDHDPSGVDMTRDLEQRLNMFCRGRVELDFRRLALTMDQVEDQNPPPNFAKESDARYKKYVETYGVTESWELDALSPEYLEGLVKDEIEPLIDWDAWNETKRRIEARRGVLIKMRDDYDPDDGTDVAPDETED